MRECERIMTYFNKGLKIKLDLYARIIRRERCLRLNIQELRHQLPRFDNAITYDTGNWQINLFFCTRPRSETFDVHKHGRPIDLVSFFNGSFPEIITDS